MPSDFSAPCYPVARKEHRCLWCGEKIAVGERHLNYRGVWGGDFQNWRMHSECEAAWERDPDRGIDGEIEEWGQRRGMTPAESDAAWHSATEEGEAR